MDITLEDVEVAIKILYEFMKKQKQAQSLLSRLGVGRERYGYGLDFKDIWNMAYKQVMAEKGINVEGEKVEEPVTSEEDIKRMKEIVKKIKSMNK